MIYQEKECKKAANTRIFFLIFNAFWKDFKLEKIIIPYVYLIVELIKYKTTPISFILLVYLVDNTLTIVNFSFLHIYAITSLSPKI